MIRVGCVQFVRIRGVPQVGHVHENEAHFCCCGRAGDAINGTRAATTNTKATAYVVIA